MSGAGKKTATYGVGTIFKRGRIWYVSYYVDGQQFVTALGEADNRNRRWHNPDTIKARLMGLDYALGRPEATWYPTETDRLSLFVDRLGISKEHLPARRYASRNGARPTFRYFVDKPPIFTMPGDTTVHFCLCRSGVSHGRRLHIVPGRLPLAAFAGGALSGDLFGRRHRLVRSGRKRFQTMDFSVENGAD